MCDVFVGLYVAKIRCLRLPMLRFSLVLFDEKTRLRVIEFELYNLECLQNGHAA